MARNTKLYGLKAVEDYIDKNYDFENIVDIDVLEGGLIDTYILYHGCGIVEVFEETYLNEWSSAYVRHIYRKGLPKRFVEALEEREREELEREAYFEALQNGTFDLMGAMI